MLQHEFSENWLVFVMKSIVHDPVFIARNGILHDYMFTPLIDRPFSDQVPC